MAGQKREEIQERDIRGLKYFQDLLPLPGGHKLSFDTRELRRT
jgi:hypothetical protein